MKIKKQVYDIVEEDLEKYPVWYFPMNETVDDELTVTPVPKDEISEMGPGGIVKTIFTDVKGIDYIGYIHWSNDEKFGRLQPAIFMRENSCTTIWCGISKPSWDEFGSNSELIKSKFPFTFKSQEFLGLESISGIIEGLYYRGDNREIICLKP